MEMIFTKLSEMLYESNTIAIVAAFVWGLLSILLSPCHLASIPLIIGFLTSQGKLKIKRTFGLSLVFSVGILVTIGIIGAITYGMGRLMGDVGLIGNIVVALVFFAVGLYLLELIRLPWEGVSIGQTRFKGYLAAFTLGLVFGIGLGPCTFAFMAPILGVVFQVSSSNQILSLSLLASFALGHCAVIVIAGTLASKVQHYLNWTEDSKVSKIVKKVCGILIILAGIYLIRLAL